MSISKPWDWNEEKNQMWLEPSEDSYYVSGRWKSSGYKTLLDFGCGLGRHSVFFTKQGFNVSAFDLSTDGTEHLKKWAEREALELDVQVADMLSLPYPDGAFDCLFAYHVISHTDTPGIQLILNEIERVIKPGGEIYITLCSKDTWSYKDACYPKIDENTVRKTEDGPEKGIPHFYVSLDDIFALFSETGFTILRIRHTDDCYWDGQKRNSKHYFILAKKTGLSHM